LNLCHATGVSNTCRYLRRFLVPGPIRIPPHHSNLARLDGRRCIHCILLPYHSSPLCRRSKSISPLTSVSVLTLGSCSVEFHGVHSLVLPYRTPRKSPRSLSEDTSLLTSICAGLLDSSSPQEVRAIYCHPYYLLLTTVSSRWCPRPHRSVGLQNSFRGSMGVAHPSVHSRHLRSRVTLVACPQRKASPS
jgi:hypothetical protein